MVIKDNKELSSKLIEKNTEIESFLNKIKH